MIIFKNIIQIPVHDVGCRFWVLGGGMSNPIDAEQQSSPAHVTGLNTDVSFRTNKSTSRGTESRCKNALGLRRRERILLDKYKDTLNLLKSVE